MYFTFLKAYGVTSAQSPNPQETHNYWECMHFRTRVELLHYVSMLVDVI